MTHKDMFNGTTYPQKRQVGGSHYQKDEDSTARVYF